MSSQFFAKPFWMTLAALAAFFGLSILVYETPFSALVLLGLGLVSLIATLTNTKYGVLIAFAELFANSHGHLVFLGEGGEQFGARMAIFLGVMLGWLFSLVCGRARLPLTDGRAYLFLPLFMAIGIGLLLGFAHQPTQDVIADANAYFYLACLFPILSTPWDARSRRELLQVLAAGAVWVSVLTLGLLYVFSHVPAHLLSNAYAFIRDTRTGELTLMVGNVFRVFIQAQFFIVIFVFLLIPFFWMREQTKKDWWHAALPYALGSAALLISLSRSFWVSVIVAAVVFLVLVLCFVRPSLKDALKAMGSHIIIELAGALILIGIVLFPFPRHEGSLGDLTSLFQARTVQTDDVAISSRWELLPAMLTSLSQQPLLGKGFGASVTFKTDDPRARAIHPDGTWTTYAMEWGWLELWLKMGLLGPVAFLFLFVMLARGLTPYLRTEQKWLGIGLFCSLVFLATAHFFSPYLNHPIGLGWLLFLLPFLEHDIRISATEILPRHALFSLGLNTQNVQTPVSTTNLQDFQS